MEDLHRRPLEAGLSEEYQATAFLRPHIVLGGTAVEGSRRSIEMLDELDLEIFEAISLGEITDTIADRMGLSATEIRLRRSKILVATGTKNWAEAVLIGIRDGALAVTVNQDSQLSLEGQPSTAIDAAQLIARGFSYGEIAQKLGFKYSTIHRYVAALSEKIDAKNINHLVRRLIEEGVVDPFAESITLNPVENTYGLFSHLLIRMWEEHPDEELTRSQILSLTGMDAVTGPSISNIIRTTRESRIINGYLESTGRKIVKNTPSRAGRTSTEERTTIACVGIDSEQSKALRIEETPVPPMVKEPEPTPEPDPIIEDPVEIEVTIGEGLPESPTTIVDQTEEDLTEEDLEVETEVSEPEDGGLLDTATENLSDELRAVLRNIANGLSVEESADQLGLSVAVIEDRQGVLLREFDALTPAHLIRKVIFRKHGELPFRNMYASALTQREIEILQYLSIGFSAKDIANMSSRGQQSYLKQLSDIRKIIKASRLKLGAKTEAQLVYAGYTTGYLGSEQAEFIERKEAQRGRLFSNEDE